MRLLIFELPPPTHQHQHGHLLTSPKPPTLMTQFSKCFLCYRLQPVPFIPVARLEPTVLPKLYRNISNKDAPTEMLKEPKNLESC